MSLYEEDIQKELLTTKNTKSLGVDWGPQPKAVSYQPSAISCQPPFF